MESLSSGPQLPAQGLDTTGRRLPRAGGFVTSTNWLVATRSLREGFPAHARSGNFLAERFSGLRMLS